MYYIINHNHHIIAADKEFLHALHLHTIEELIKKTLLKEISFTEHFSSELHITVSEETHTFSMHSTKIESMLGDLTLIHLEPIKEQSGLYHSATPSEETLLSNDSLTEIAQESEQKISRQEEEEETLNLLRDQEDTFNLSLPDDTDIQEKISLDHSLDTLAKSDSDALVDLDIPLSPTEILHEKDHKSEVSKDDDALDTDPILIDIKKVSDEIGISQEDYKTFLNDYIDTALSLEDELQSEDEKSRLSAMNTLTQLADVLQLPKVNKIIKKLSVVPEEELSSVVESFFQTLARLTTDVPNEKSDTALKTNDREISDSIAEKEENLPIQGFGKIYLDDVKPIHFDFRLEEASDDLSLPVELIEEFVHDFIEQAHTETKKMLRAYEEGDLKTIQKIGHLLKGASSNLRINELSDTLYDIQFCEDIDKLESLIKRYWAHFISFEHHINMITKHEGNM